MRRIIAGATGLIGSELVKLWLEQGIEIVVIGRDKQKIIRHFGNNVSAYEWSELSVDKINDAELIVNLAGANIGDKLWTDARKNEILSSRIEATKTLSNLCAQLGEKSPVLFNASAVGIYPFGEEEYTEENGLSAPSSFLNQVGQQWENATQIAKDNHVRVINLRFGVVLAKQGGALPKMALPFYFCVGGKIGSGNQWLSWTTIPEINNAIEFIFKHSNINGAVNIVAPQAVRQKEFAEALAKTLHRPSLFPFPEIIVKLIFGEMGRELLLSGQHVIPKKLTDAGYIFLYPTLSEALQMIFRK